MRDYASNGGPSSIRAGGQHAKGITAPVTATLDLHATNATLALRRPAKQPTAIVEGKVRPLAARFLRAPANDSELDRILRLHLESSSGRSDGTVAAAH